MWWQQLSVAKNADCTWHTLKKASKEPSKAAAEKESSQRLTESRVSSLTFCVMSASRASGEKWRPLIERLSSCFSWVHCGDSGDGNVARVSLRVLACLQNASVLWSRHRPAGGGGRREERWALWREERRQDRTAAVWASSLLARLLKVIIEFLCRASPPCGMLLSARYEADGECRSVGCPLCTFAVTLYATNES